MRWLPVLAVAFLLAGCGAQTTGQKLESAFTKPGVYGAKCQQVGVIDAAGSTQDLYSCQKTFPQGPLGPRLCAVWIHDQGYVVTKQARLIADARGEKPPC